MKKADDKYSCATLTAAFRSEGHYQAFLPIKALRPFIAQYWIFQLTQRAEHDKYELEQPSLLPEIIFKFGVDYLEYFPKYQSQEIKSDSCVNGVRNLVSASKRTDLNQPLFLVGIKFHPLGMHLLLRFPLFELYNKSVSISDLGNELIIELEDRISALQDAKEIIRLLDSTFLQYYSGAALSGDDFALLDKISRLQFDKLKELSESYRLNYKFLDRKFKKYIGINPKEYFSTRRYLGFYSDWLQHGQYKYIDLVYKHGYYDQNHLIKAFKSYLGDSPNQFSRLMKENYTQHIALADIGAQSDV